MGWPSFTPSTAASARCYGNRSKPAFTRSEYEKWKKVIVEGKIKPE
jgi:hypothetical protein